MEPIVELCLQIEHAFQTKLIDAGYALIEQFFPGQSNMKSNQVLNLLTS